MLQNRVNPWGKLCAVPDRGSLMGNRGILHDADNKIVRAWKHRNWVTCLLSYKGIKREHPFSPGNYSELFFLDEATSFAAGHRPCAYCQRARNREFKSSWAQANIAGDGSADLTMAELDKQLHVDRVEFDGSKKTYRTSYGSLPVGTMFEHGGGALVRAQNGPQPWSFTGYSSPIPLAKEVVVTVLTPRSVVSSFAAGFVPCLHPTASS